MRTYEPGEVTLTQIPADIDLSRLLLNKNQCQDNAYKTTRDYDYDYVEGVITLVDKDGGTKSAAHAWNVSKGGNFDVTETLWIGEKYEEIAEIRYVPVLSYQSDEMPQGGIPFSEETLGVVDYFNAIRDWAFKPNTRVILKDPANGKPVADALITWFDPETKVYTLNILRLNNSIPFEWPEAHIERSTTDQVEKAENLLAQVELASDPLVGTEDIKDKSIETIINFKIDVPAYTVYYKQLNIAGAVNWRLVTMVAATT